MSEAPLLVDGPADGVLTLTLNRPDARNALSLDLLEALHRALDQAAGDPDVRALVITGAGRAFCAGGDLHAMVERRGDAQATFERQREQFGPLVRKLLHLEKPVVAHVNGHAMGAGLMLVLAADLAYASEDAKFGAAFANVALIPDTGGTWLMPRLLGLRQAKALYLLPDPFPAARAKELDIVHDVLPADALSARVRETATRLAQGPTQAYGLAKRALLEGATGTLDEALAREANLQGLCFTLHDHAEGVDAVLEKRQPRFTGR